MSHPLDDNNHLEPDEHLGTSVARPPLDLTLRIESDIAHSGGENQPDPAMDGAIGATMFDQPGSEDGSVTVLLPKNKLQLAPSQSLVRIKSRRTGDGRSYLGIVTAGPFVEPDSLRADSHLLVTVTTKGGVYLPPHHGRIQVMILGEELKDGTLTPPRLRPLPNSPVHALSEEESAKVLKAEGDIRLGLVVGHQNVAVGIPSTQKQVLPRHLAILGTTGGGKSMTVAGLVQQAQAANMAVVLLDVEGEYTQMNEPTSDARMLNALAERGLRAAGIPSGRMTLYHLVGRDTANPKHPDLRTFSIQFARLSPYAVMELLGLNDAQTDRFLFAYDLAKQIMRDLGIFPRKDVSPEEKDRDERILLQLDEFERGYPRLTLSFFMDIVGKCKALVSNTEFTPYNADLKTSEAKDIFKKHLSNKKELPGSASSWGKLLSLLWRMHRLRVFDRGNTGKPIIYSHLLRPGQVSVVDLSDTGMAELTNLAIADMLRGIQEEQEKAYTTYEKTRNAGQDATPPSRVLLIIEEAHEFLSEERIDKMPILFQQVAKLAKRGRKRWIGLTFVTQLPQQLPRQLLAMVNNYILHKIMDAQMLATLRKTISNIDEGQWDRLAGLAPGQALVSFAHMARPLLVAVDPAPVKLRLID
jgi:DNA helicase HerA-like ATPase